MTSGGTDSQSTALPSHTPFSGEIDGAYSTGPSQGEGHSSAVPQAAEPPGRGRSSASAAGSREAHAGRRPALSRAAAAQAAPAQARPGIASRPGADVRGALLQGLVQASRQGRADHRRRFGHRPRRGGAVRARGRRCRHRASRRAAGRGDHAPRRRGRRAALPGDRGRRRRARLLLRCRRAHGEGAGRPRRAGQQRRLPAPCLALRGSRRGAVRPHAQDQPLRLLPHGAGRRAAPQAGLGDRQQRLGDRPAGQQVPARLFDDQGRHPRLHPLAGRPSRAARHPGQRRGAGPGLDAAQSGRQAGGRRRASSAPTCR